jgi:ATP-dependent RNA helicase DHX57
VIYVIDAGKVKETQYDPETNLSRLVETWVTCAAAKQRRGRAGRTQPGTCYKLYTKKQEMDMTKFPIPEILRVPLESILLAVKATKEDQDIKVGDMLSISRVYLGSLSTGIFRSSNRSSFHRINGQGIDYS